MCVLSQKLYFGYTLLSAAPSACIRFCTETAPKCDAGTAAAVSLFSFSAVFSPLLHSPCSSAGLNSCERQQ